MRSGIAENKSAVVVSNAITLQHLQPNGVLPMPYTKSGVAEFEYEMQKSTLLNSYSPRLCATPGASSRRSRPTHWLLCVIQIHISTQQRPKSITSIQSQISHRFPQIRSSLMLNFPLGQQTIIILRCYGNCY